MQKASALEEKIRGGEESIAYTRGSRNHVRSGTQMCDFSQCFRFLEFFGQRILLLVASAEDLNVVGFRVLARHFDGLAFTKRRHKGALGSERVSHAGLQKLLKVRQRVLADDLHGFEAGTIGKLNKD